MEIVQGYRPNNDIKKVDLSKIEDQSPFSSDNWKTNGDITGDELITKGKFPPPIKVETEQLREANSSFKTGEIGLNKDGMLIRKFLTNIGFTNDIIESMNERFDQFAHVVKNTKIRFGDKYIGFDIEYKRPSTILEKTETEVMYTPIVARENNLTYSHAVNVKMYLRQSSGVNIEEKLIALGKVPTMIGCKMDNLESIDYLEEMKRDGVSKNNLILELGECPYDVKGYFVITGNEYVILNQDGLSPNRIFVHPESDLMAANYIALKDNNKTEKIRIFRHPKTGDYRVSPYGSSDTEKSLNIFQLFRLFTLSGVENIYKKILEFANLKYRNLIINELASTRFVYEKYTSVDLDYEKLADLKIDGKKDTVEDEEETVKRNYYDKVQEWERNLGELYERFFPQYTKYDEYGELSYKYVDDNQYDLEKIEYPSGDVHYKFINVYTKDDSGNVGQANAWIDSKSASIQMLTANGEHTFAKFVVEQNFRYIVPSRERVFDGVTKRFMLDAESKDKKLDMFAIMINRLIEVNIGARKYDNRDGWENKIIRTPSYFIYKTMMNKWNYIVESIKKKVADAMIEKRQDITLGAITLEKTSFTNEFITSFTTNWNTGNWKKEERVTDLLSRQSLIAAYRYVTRISAPGSRKNPSMSIRGVEPSQYGFVDFIDTPEGKNCGLLRSKAVGCWLSINRKLDALYPVLNQLQSISNVKGDRYRNILMINGKLIGYCDGPGLYRKLITYQRKKTIKFDINILFVEQDNILYIETTAGRPMRPLLVVDEGEPQQLVLYHKIKQGIVSEDDDFDTIMDAECIDYVSPWKQDQIILAESLNELKTRENDINNYEREIQRVKLLNESNSNPMYLSINSTKQPIFLSWEDYIIELKDKIVKHQKDKNELTNELNNLSDLTESKITEYEQYIKNEDQRISDELNVPISSLFEIKDTAEYKFVEQQVKYDTSEFTINVKKYLENVDKKVVELETKIEEIQHNIEILNKKLTEDSNRPVNDVYLEKMISTLQSKINAIISKRKYTHCEIDPNSLFGIAASVIPHPDQNQGPRNTYACNMISQALGIFLSNYRHRTDKTSKALANPTIPIYQTQMNEMIGLNKLGSGQMVVLAIMSYLNYGEEDAIIMNQDAVDRGLFKMVVNKTYTAETEHETTGTKESRVTIQDRFSPIDSEFPKSRNDEVYDHIDDRGVAKIGSMAKEGDCIIAIKRTITEGGQSYSVDKSVYVPTGEDGIVDRVIFSNKMVKVKIRRVVNQIVANKFASRYAQKSTISIMLKDRQMPYFERNGSRPSIIMNPHAIPSRMTNGQLTEMVMSKAGVIKGERVNATAFNDDFDVDTFKSILKDNGYNEWGWEPMVNGMTGERFMAHIFAGPVYYQALKHHVQDKASVRRGGILTDFSRQPIGGRQRGGGLKFGEMERDAILSHAAPALMKEVYQVSSDKYTCLKCLNCNQIAYRDSSERFRCPVCKDKAEFGRVDVPYSYMILNRYLAGAGITSELITRPPTNTEAPVVDINRK